MKAGLYQVYFLLPVHITLDPAVNSEFFYGGQNLVSKVSDLGLGCDSYAGASGVGPRLHYFDPLDLAGWTRSLPGSWRNCRSLGSAS